MFVSVRGTDSGAWSSQSSQESRQPLQAQQSKLSPALVQAVRVLSADVSTTLSALPASYISRPSGKLRPDSINPGIQTDEKGRRYISDGGNTFAIRYDRDHGTERVYQPRNPTRPGIPVRLNSHGEYERHHEVGLRGGSRGRELRAQLDAIQGRRAMYAAEELHAQHALASIDAEIQRSQHPGVDLQTRRQELQLELASVRSRIVGVDMNMDGVRREAQQLRHTLQNELALLRGCRADGGHIVHSMQRDINALETAMRGAQTPPNAHNDLRALNDMLRERLMENNDLDIRISIVDGEIGDIPQV